MKNFGLLVMFAVSAVFWIWMLESPIRWWIFAGGAIAIAARLIWGNSEREYYHGVGLRH